MAVGEASLRITGRTSMALHGSTEGSESLGHAECVSSETAKPDVLPASLMLLCRNTEMCLPVEPAPAKKLLHHFEDTDLFPGPKMGS